MKYLIITFLVACFRKSVTTNSNTQVDNPVTTNEVVNSNKVELINQNESLKNSIKVALPDQAITNNVNPEVSIENEDIFDFKKFDNHFEILFKNLESDVWLHKLDFLDKEDNLIGTLEGVLQREDRLLTYEDEVVEIPLNVSKIQYIDSNGNEGAQVINNKTATVTIVKDDEEQEEDKVSKFKKDLERFLTKFQLKFPEDKKENEYSTGLYDAIDSFKGINITFDDDFKNFIRSLNKKYKLVDIEKYNSSVMENILKNDYSTYSSSDEKSALDFYTSECKKYYKKYRLREDNIETSKSEKESSKSKIRMFINENDKSMEINLVSAYINLCKIFKPNKTQDELINEACRELRIPNYEVNNMCTIKIQEKYIIPKLIYIKDKISKIEDIAIKEIHLESLFSAFVNCSVGAKGKIDTIESTLAQSFKDENSDNLEKYFEMKLLNLREEIFQNMIPKIAKDNGIDHESSMIINPLRTLLHKKLKIKAGDDEEQNFYSKSVTDNQGEINIINEFKQKYNKKLLVSLKDQVDYNQLYNLFDIFIRDMDAKLKGKNLNFIKNSNPVIIFMLSCFIEDKTFNDSFYIFCLLKMGIFKAI